MSENKKEVNVGCGCLTDVIGLLILIIILDIVGCDWCHGFTDNLIHTFKQDKVENNIHPSDLR